MRCNAGVNYDIFLAGILGDGNAAYDFEAVAVVQLVGDAAEGGVKIGKRKGVLVDFSKSFAQPYGFVSLIT